jgi:glycosyltransferase involved in cell wall biosynthesis
MSSRRTHSPSPVGGSPLPLSVVVLARNEADRIERCVRSVSRCDDVWVVDDHSTDATRERARSAGACVVSHAFSTFAGQRNWALESLALRHPWVLMLDADEAATEPFLQALTAALGTADEQTVAFRTCRKTMLAGQWLKHADGFPVWIMRVVRRGAAWFEDCGHGEVPVPEVRGRIGTIRPPFLHEPFSRGLSDWLERHIRYATREAELELEGGRRIRLGDLLTQDAARRRRALRDMSRRMPLRPSLRFFYRYVLQGGFLDGREGFVFSALMASYERMIVMKRWELQRGQRRPGGRNFRRRSDDAFETPQGNGNSETSDAMCLEARQ